MIVSALRAITIACAVCVALPACSKKSESSTSPAIKVAEYTLRGRIATVPEPGKPAGGLQIHHEPIPEFKSNFNALPDGMAEMTMPFPLAEGVSLEAFKPRDAVEFTFAVDYDASSGAVISYRVIRIAPLAPGASLQINE